MANFNPHLHTTEAPPVMEARRWIEGVTFAPDTPLLNLSQAAPVDPPPLALRQAMAEAVLHDTSAHLYGPVLGLPDLRAAVAARWSRDYAGDVHSDQIAITSGCNQAFAAAMATLASQGDNVILPTPWYFNHKMWLDMNGVETRPLETGAGLLPDPEAARALITPRTRAIVLVTPNNPGGVEYPADLVLAFFEVARAHGIALIVDETYRDFDSRTGAPHALFQQPDWDKTLIQLYSFSKAYRLTGHRTGAICTSVTRLAEVEKWLDTVAICPGQIGQRAALWGMENLDPWLAEQRTEILARKAAMLDGFSALPDWTVMGCGAYFAYVGHPFDMRSDDLARLLVHKAALLVLPGTMFGPSRDQGGTGRAETTLRIAFANADRAGIATLFDRLGQLRV